MGKQRIKSKNVRSRLTYDEDEWGSLLPFFREKYALDEGGYAENTADKWYKSVRKFFIWFKVNRLKGVEEEDFVDYRYTSTEDPKYEAEEVVEWTEEKLNRKFKENDGYGLIDADKCIEKEKDGENRSNFLKRFREKKRAAEDPALGTVHVDVEDVKNVRAVDLADFLDYRRKEIEDERREEGVPQNKLTPKKATARQYKNALQHFIDMCSKEKYLNFREQIDIGGHSDYQDELEKYDSPTVNNGGSKVDYEDCKNMIRNLHDHKRRAIILTFLKTGMRCSELVNLRFSDLHLDENWIYIRYRKNGYQQSLCIDEELVKVLEPYIESKKNQIKRTKGEDHLGSEEFVFTHSGLKNYSTAGMRDLVKATAKTYGIDIKGPHDFRHTFAYQYGRDFGDSERGRDFFKKVQLSHNENLSTSENYSEALNEPEEGPCKERKEDYDKAIPNYLPF